MKPMYSAKLACGHWSEEQTTEVFLATVQGGVVACMKHPCDGSDSEVITDEIRRNGKRRSNGHRVTITDVEPFQPKPPMRWRNGLIVQSTSRRSMSWWCQFCDGRRPEPMRKGRVKNMDAVWEQWDVHKVGPVHLSRAQGPALAERVARAVDPNRV